MKLVAHIFRLSAAVISSFLLLASTKTTVFASKLQANSQGKDLDELISSQSLWILAIASVLLAVLAAISLHIHPRREILKKLLFYSIIAVSLVSTGYLVVSTVYLNMNSISKGPVHWHADFEIWACGKEVNLRDPEGLSNKIGIARLHEHNDNRIHLEGVVLHDHDATISNFFRVIGGDLTTSSVSLPVENNEMLSYKNGDMCDSGVEGEVQTFVYTTEGDTFSQRKVDPDTHVYAPEGAVPPGDCIIVEFDEPKEKTDRICQGYEAAEFTGKIKRAE